MLNKSIPNVLELEIKFNVSDEVFTKNTFISLDIEKLKLEEVNKKREKSSKKLIEYNDIEIFLKNVSVNNDTLEIVINENYNESNDMSEDIKSLFKINKKCIDKNLLSKKINLKYEEDYKNQLKENNDKLFNESYRNIYCNNIKNEIGEENYESINEKRSRYNMLFSSIINQNINLLKNAFNDLKETESYKFVSNDDLLIYLPDSNLIEIPTNIYSETSDIESVEFLLRYPNNDNNSEGIILHKYSHPYKENWSNDILYHNESKIDTGLYPSFMVDENNEISLSKPVEKKEYYLRLFYGINKKLFEANNLDQSIEIG